MRQTTLPAALTLLLLAGCASTLVGCSSSGPGAAPTTPRMSGQVTDSAGPTGTPPGTAAPATVAPPSRPADPSGTRRPPPSPTGTRAVPANATVRVTRSGGFAGLTETVTVRPDGRWVRDGGGSRPEGWLTAAERSRLNALLGDPRLGAEAGVHLPQGCADTYRWTFSAGSVKVTYDECLPPADRPPATVAVVAYLVTATS